MVKHLDVRIDLGADTGADARVSVQALQGRLAAIQERIKETSVESSEKELAGLLLDKSLLLVEIGRMPEAWESARRAFDISIAYRQWGLAGKACEAMFRTGLKDSLPALGQGVWLTVTFPVDAELTVALLEHVIEETPDHADGAAVAAMAAVYIVDLRAEGAVFNDLSVYTRQMLTTVARRHSGVEDQTGLDAWMGRLDLTDPGRLLPRLRIIVDALVEDNWWFDLSTVQAQIPDQ